MPVGKLDFENVFTFLREFGLDFLFLAAKEEWAENLVHHVNYD